MTRIFIIFSLIFTIDILSLEGFKDVNDFGIGPSFGYMNDNFVFNFDVSYTAKTFVTLSTNYKLFSNNSEWNSLIQMELSFWFFIEFGGGVGYQFKDNNQFMYDFFVGIPIPIVPIQYILDQYEKYLFSYFYIVPYYKINIFGNEKLHEFGLYLKFSTYDVLE